jgi:hypothetical protein
MVVKCKIVVAQYAHDTVFGMQLTERMGKRKGFLYAKSDEVTREADKVGLLGVDGVYNVL